ncbi:TrkA family potassium uptake protein [Paludicola sp. MB14-C6]|uniref:potassium channel family protein n=1 Tax=Paludihabitans sp. MB14-C6 TaxID=3070656 RepID=UPI0027DC9F64|nr:TrkA family potassium uptake protein [Paludicola sp. MB14-C6]WMJ22994.1 TrkA family potassium uptake protein [Paludicola sp. MB14-C6]
MNIIIFGGNNSTEFIIKNLMNNGDKVVLVNPDYDFCYKITDRYEVVSFCEDEINELVFKKAKADKADLVISLYDNDADNLIICEYAKKVFHVKTTYSIVNNPDNIEIFNKLGVDQCISVSTIINQMINQTNIELGIEKYFKKLNNNYLVRELQVSKKSEFINKKLWELNLPDSCNMISIFRNNEIIIPQGNTQILQGDRILLLATPEALDYLPKMKISVANL